MKSLNYQQLTFIEDPPIFPSTRFQGSKFKLTDWIWDSVKNLEFHSVLDAFGGAGCVGYMFKKRGKKVAYNDLLKFNWYIGKGLIENEKVKLSEKDYFSLISGHNNITYPTFISDTFKDIYFTDEENQWIDMVVKNIDTLENIYKKSLAYFALFQSCIIKRPYNLFHRKNLYIRLSDVKRSFGNKVTWDTSFEIHFEKFFYEANRSVFSNGLQNRAINSDVFDIEGSFDLVYIDTPYISKKGVGVNYRDFYHFLEGLVNYSDWDKMIDFNSKHRKLKRNYSIWDDKREIHKAFDKLIHKFRDSILVISYRSDGIPSIRQLRELLKKYKSQVKEIRYKNYKYVLSNNSSDEVLLIAY